MLKVWNMALLIATFALAIQGTFIVRSGIISSVHSFAQSEVGPYFFGFLGLILVYSIGLLLYRLPLLKDERAFESVVSRESGFLLNNLLLGGIAFATYWGTIFPLVSEAFRGVRSTVGAPFYEQVNGPLLLILLVLMGIGPLIPWRKATMGQLLRVFLYPVTVAGITATALLVAGLRQPAAILALAVCAFVTGTILWEYIRGVQVRRRSTGERILLAVAGLVWSNRSRYGGYIVHLGVVLMAVGVVSSSSFQIEREATLVPGQQLTVGRYTLTYQGLRESQIPKRREVWAPMAVSVDGRPSGEILPAKFIYRNFEQQPATHIGLRLIGLEDLYVVLAAWSPDGTATFIATVNPLVMFIWIGGGVLVLGTLVTLWPHPRPARVATSVRRTERIALELR